VLDCANGAAYRAAPEVLWELGAEVISMGVSPDGFNINDGVGSTATDAAAQRIREVRADLGICLDGDADRVILIDETGSGGRRRPDHGAVWPSAGRRGPAEGRHAGRHGDVEPRAGAVPAWGKGLSLDRTAVGDRYVVEAMRAGGWNLGGEQSGHIVMTDYATTGDGLMAALQFLAEMVRTGRPASSWPAGSSRCRRC
jgi:phosphoglucosamine mutase